MGAWERITVRMPAETIAAARQTVERDGYESLDQLVHLAMDEWFSIQRSDARKLESLRAAIKEGEESGPGIPAEDVYAELRELIASFEIRSEAA